MNENVEIVCPHCTTVNRVQSARLGDRPKCGKCKQELFAAHPVDLTAADFDQVISRTERMTRVEANPYETFLFHTIYDLPYLFK